MDIVMIFKSSRVICCHNDLDGYFDEDGDNISPQVDLMEGLQLDRDPWGRRRSSRWQIFSLCLFSNLWHNDLNPNVTLHSCKLPEEKARHLGLHGARRRDLRHTAFCVDEITREC